MTKPHLSASQLNMIGRCGEQYRRRYVEGEKIPAAKINKKIATLRKKGEGDKKLTKPERTELSRLNLAKTLKKMKK